MKILLANPAVRESIGNTRERYFIKAGSRWPWSYIKNKKEKNGCCFFPFFLAYTANVLRKGGFDVQVIDGVAMDLPEEEFLRRVKRIKPELIVIETATHAINHDLLLCRKLKENLTGTKVLLSGAHATTFARQILEASDHVDFIAMGEYEYTTLELAKRLADGGDDFKIEGLGYKLGGEIWVSARKGFIENINSLPYPAFDLFPSNDSPELSVYRDGICTYFPAVTLHSSRGCPFRCDFCMWNQIMYDNGPYRVFQPSRVADEMEYVMEKFGAKEVYFDDDDFFVNKQHVLDICREIKERNLKIKWSCMGDAITCDEEMIRTMADSGCIFLKFGVESGSRQILKNIEKPLDPEKAVQLARWCRKYGIMSHATFCFGLDGETGETMKKTLSPGTMYYNKLRERGYLKELNWDAFDGTMSCAFDTEELSAREVESFRKKTIRSIVLHKIIDPGWIGRFLKRNFLLMKYYGIKTVLEPVKALVNL
jgi:anaerobic magnesium-protoporphyrin IX monomethyl ester cyclase